MWYIGDIHGQFDAYHKIIKQLCRPTLQLGDFGLGFNVDHKFHDDEAYPRNRFIRGNHDNPAVCRQKKSYLGDYGVFGGTFYASGAFSVDRVWRRAGVDWWADEELSSDELEKAVDLYAATNPDVVATHDAPYCVYDRLVSTPNPSRTTMAFNKMLRHWEPKVWVFGHHHASFDFRVGVTRFIGLGCGQCEWVEP